MYSLKRLFLVFYFVFIFFFNRHERIKKIRCNIKALEVKEFEIKSQYEELIASHRKRNLYPNRQIVTRLTNLKRQLRMIQFQRQVEKFLAEDLRLEDEYYELRLKLTKPLPSSMCFHFFNE